MKRSLHIEGALGRLPIFLAVASHRSFSAAAAELKISASAASQAVMRLEAELGVSLLVRTTRSVGMTDEGARLFEQTAPAIAVTKEALSSMTAVRDSPSGSLRLSIPRVAVRSGFRRALSLFATSHPEVEVDVTVDDRLTDIVKEGFDAGVRARESVHKDMITARLTAPIRFVVVGSPKYFAVHGRPARPRDLLRHQCLGWHSLSSKARYRWEFQARRQDIEIAVKGPLISNDADVLVSAATDGLGLAYVAEHEVAEQVETGRLATVLDRFAIEISGLFLYYPSAARTVPKLRAFVDCVRAIGGLL